MTATIKMDDRRVRRSFRVLGKALPRIYDKYVDDVTKAASIPVKKYPSKLPNQKYKRTGRYGRGVKRVKSKRARLGGLFGGRASRQGALTLRAVFKGRDYAPYVGGNSEGKGQAGIHQGRWAVAYEELEKAADRMKKRPLKEMIRAMKRGG